MEKLNIEQSEIDQIFTEMNSAIAVFEGWDGKAFEEDIENMDKMNSDFIEQFSRALEVVERTGKKKIAKNMKQYVQDAKDIKDGFDTLNEKASKALEG